MPTLHLPLPRAAYLVIPRLRAEAEASGLTWEGDESAGRVAGHGFSAHYTVSEDILTVQYRKPLLLPVPERVIRARLTDLLKRV